ncbi:MAG: hypothetical protein ACYTGB_18790 [Planctomycetota bacterium]
MLKRLVNRLLGALGYRVVRVSREPVPAVDPAEIRELEEDLRRFSRESDSKWSDPAVVRGYLEDRRIALYHRILEISAQHGATCDGKRVADFGTCTGYLLRLISRSAADCDLHGAPG